MEFARVLRELERRRRLLLVGVLVAAVAAIFSVYRLDGLKLEARSLQHSSATTQVLVDSPSSVLGNLSQPFEPLTERSLVYANFMTSPVVLNVIGEIAGIPGAQIYAAGPVEAGVQRVEQEPTALKRNVEIAGETRPYRLNFNTTAGLPTIAIYSQAPTTAQAVTLANAAATGLKRYVATLEQADGTHAGSRVTIRQLGTADGSVSDPGISKSVAALVFVAVFALWCLLMLAGARFRTAWRASAGTPQAEDGQPRPQTAPAGGALVPNANGNGNGDHPVRPPDPDPGGDRQNGLAPAPTPSAPPLPPPAVVPASPPSGDAPGRSPVGREARSPAPRLTGRFSRGRASGGS